MDRKSKDRNAKQPENGQMMTELKYLKAQIVAKDKRIKELEAEVKAFKDAKAAEAKARDQALADELTPMIPGTSFNDPPLKV